MPKKILITGGAGFIGSNAVVYFNKLGTSTEALSKLKSLTNFK